VAAAYKVKSDCGLKGGMLIGNPIPEKYAMNFDFINKKIDEAVNEAAVLGIKGKEITPFLLDKIQKLTGGKSLEANIKLVYSNAALGAKIALEYSRLRS